jgi:Asp/Glu/hydantoin racemase
MTKTIALINPNTTANMTEAMAREARLVVDADTEVLAFTARFGPVSIEGTRDEALAALDAVRANESANAFVIACFGDSGLDAAREITRSLAEDCSEAIVLGCGGMAKLAARLPDELGVPAIDGAIAAAKLAESLIDLRLQTSKRLTYAAPIAKAHRGSLGVFSMNV